MVATLALALLLVLVTTSTGADPGPARRVAPVDGPVATPAAAAPRPLPALTVRGGRLLADGRPYAFHGVNRDSLEWGPENWGGCGGDGHFTDHDLDLIASWGATAIRVPLSQAGWAGRRCAADEYARRVDDVVRRITARRMHVILDLHWTDAGGRQCDADCLTGQQPMPDAGSVVFWRSVAARYGRDPGVVFGLFNEPHDVSWDCWRNGGCRVGARPPLPGTSGPAYDAVGMQDLVDAVRGTGARNLLLVGGLDWAYDLSGVEEGYALRGRDIAYDTHVYTQFHRTTADWDAHFGRVARTHAVVSTEFGSIDCSAGDTRRLLDYFDAPGGDPRARMSWTIWSWNSPGDCTQPSVIADWEGTPMPGQGGLIRERMLAARAGP